MTRAWPLRRRATAELSSGHASASAIVTVAVCIGLLTLMIVSVAFGIRGELTTPRVVQVTARQQAFADRYVRDILLTEDGRAASPERNLDYLRLTVQSLLHGGPVAGLEGNLEDRDRVPAQQEPDIVAKLREQARLVDDLEAAGERYLAAVQRGRTAVTELQRLRVTSSELATVAADTAISEADHAHAAQQDLFARQIAFGALGAVVALVAAWLVWRSGRRASAQYRAIVHHSQDVIFVLDADRIVQYATPSVEDLLGFAPNDLIGKPAWEFLMPGDVGRLSADRADAEAEGRVVRAELRLRHADGSFRVAECTLHDQTDEPHVRGFVVAARNVTDRHRAETALRASEHRLNTIIETAPDAIVTADRYGVIVEFNTAAQRIFGYSVEEAVGRNVGVLMSSQESAAHQHHIDHFVSTGESQLGMRARELTAVRKNGEEFPILLALSETSVGDDPLFTAIVRDISERRAFERQLEHQATHDPLTGMPNRRLFLERVAEAQARAQRLGHGVAVLFLDLDRFKDVNDTLGHSQGDRLLIEAARRIQETVRTYDTVARLGGDEFTILCEHIDSAADATHLAERLGACLAAPFELDVPAYVTSSIGIATWIDETPEELLRNADTAMYRAKAAGRDGWHLFDEEMQAWVESRRGLEAALRHAIDAGELVLHYQPVIDIATGRSTRCEALTRWERPGYGRVPPGDFIGLAEDTGLIEPLGAWAIREAVRQLSVWRSAGFEINVAVNVSSRQLQRGDLIGIVQDALATFDVPSRLLTLEITESVVLNDVDSALGKIRRLRELGVKVALDDFGTGYSSLTYLREFPLDIVKIDQSFVRALGTDAANETIVASIISMAHVLGLETVAEGVSMPEHLDVLRKLGCDAAQGFHFLPPVPPDEIVGFFRAAESGVLRPT